MAMYKSGGEPPSDLAEAEDASLVPVPFTTRKLVPALSNEEYMGQSDAPPLYTDPGASPTATTSADPTLPVEPLPPFPYENEREGDARWAAHKAAVVAAPLTSKVGTAALKPYGR